MNTVFEIDNMKIKVKVHGNKDHGLYRLHNESATGKTRLYNLLKQYMVAGLPVGGYSYIDLKTGTTKISHYLNKGLKLFIVDRYDMYNGQMASDIVELSESCIVLVDCKDIPRLGVTMTYKGIVMERDCIHIG